MFPMSRIRNGLLAGLMMSSALPMYADPPTGEGSMMFLLEPSTILHLEAQRLAPVLPDLGVDICPPHLDDMVFRDLGRWTRPAPVVLEIGSITWSSDGSRGSVEIRARQLCLDPIEIDRLLPGWSYHVALRPEAVESSRLELLVSSTPGDSSFMGVLVLPLRFHFRKAETGQTASFDDRLVLRLSGSWSSTPGDNAFLPNAPYRIDGDCGDNDSDIVVGEASDLYLGWREVGAGAAEPEPFCGAAELGKGWFCFTPAQND